MANSLEAEEWERRKKVILEEERRGITTAPEIAKRHPNLFKNSSIVYQARAKFPELRHHRKGPVQPGSRRSSQRL